MQHPISVFTKPASGQSDGEANGSLEDLKERFTKLAGEDNLFTLMRSASSYTKGPAG